jgi:hypothetical protein
MSGKNTVIMINIAERVMMLMMIVMIDFHK